MKNTNIITTTNTTNNTNTTKTNSIKKGVDNMKKTNKIKTRIIAGIL